MVAPARVRTTIVEEPVVQKPDETQVYAYVESDYGESEVSCKVETENNVDTITCGW